MIAYLNGNYLSWNEIRISPDDRGFLFADALYEVMRSYSGKVFQLQEHIARLNFGAREIRLPTTDFGYLKTVADELIQRNGLTTGDAVIYIQVTRGAAPRAHRFPPADTPLTVYVSIKPFNSNKDEQQKGIRAIFVPDQRWARTDIKSVGLLPNVLAQQKAVEASAQEAIFIRQGAVMEGTHSTVFAVINGFVTTPPRTNYILGGITRKVIFELCESLKLPHRERTIFQAEVQQAEELFISGTTVEITPVVEVDGKPIGTGKPGSLTRRLQQAFGALTQSL